MLPTEVARHNVSPEVSWTGDGQDPRHSDNVARGDLQGAAPAAESSRVDGRVIDNAARAAAAERERTFTGGGDEGIGAGAPVATTPPTRPSLVAAAASRVRGLERPSPFGVGHFPPLPLPPGMRKP